MKDVGFGTFFSFIENPLFEERKGAGLLISAVCATTAHLAGAPPQTGLRCWGAAVGARCVEGVLAG